MSSINPDLHQRKKQCMISGFHNASFFGKGIDICSPLSIDQGFPYYLRFPIFEPSFIAAVICIEYLFVICNQNNLRLATRQIRFDYGFHTVASVLLLDVR